MLPTKALIATTIVREKFNDEETAQVHALIQDGPSTDNPADTKGLVEPDANGATPGEQPKLTESASDISKSDTKLKPPKHEEKPASVAEKKATWRTKKHQASKSKDKTAPSSKPVTLRREMTQFSDVPPDDPTSPREAEKPPELQTDSDQE